MTSETNSVLNNYVGICIILRGPERQNSTYQMVHTIHCIGITHQNLKSQPAKFTSTCTSVQVCNTEISPVNPIIYAQHWTDLNSAINYDVSTSFHWLVIKHPRDDRHRISVSLACQDGAVTLNHSNTRRS